MPTLRDVQQRTGARVVAAVGCNDAPDIAACLRGKSVETIVGAVPGGTNIYPRVYGPNVDGHVFPDQPAKLIKAGRYKPMWEFIQKRLAQTFRELADEVNIEAHIGGYKMGETWAEEGGFVKGRPTPFNMLTDEMKAAPDYVPLRFMSVDVQKRGFYWLVRSWSGDGRSRMHSCGYCFEWKELVDIHKKAGVHQANVFVDCGDQQDDVFVACATNGWVATRGDQRNDFPWKIRTPMGMKTELRAYSPPVVESVGSKRAKKFFFSNLRLKDTLSRLIRLGRHTKADDAPSEYLAQMVSEKRVITPGGRPLWEQIADRANHFWDCEVIGMLPALAWRLTGKSEQMSTGDEPPQNEEAS